MDWAATSYRNPRMQAEIKDWPSGVQKVTALFHIEADKAVAGGPGGRERAVRITYAPPAGRASAPKKLTYAIKMRIVTGDDGRTYIAALTGYGHITIYRGDMKYHHESVFEREPRYAELKALFA